MKEEHLNVRNKVVAFLPFLGLAFYRDWTTLSFFDANLTYNSPVNPYLTSTPYAFQEAGCCLALAYFAARHLVGGRELDRRAVLAIATISAIATAVLMVDLHLVGLGVVARSAANAILGVGFGVFLIAWGLVLSRLDQRTIAWYVLIALVADRVVYLAGTAFPQAPLGLVNLGLPLLTTIMWLKADSTTCEQGPHMITDRESLSRIPWFLLIVMAACQALSALFSGIVVHFVGGVESLTVNTLMRIASGVAVAGVILSWLYRSPGELNGLWYEFVMLIAAGILMFLAFNGNHEVLAASVVIAGGYSFTCFFMLLLPCMCSELKIPATFFLGMGNLLCYRIPEFTGTMLGDSFGVSMELEGNGLPSVLLAIVFLLFLVMLWTLRQSTRPVKTPKAEKPFSSSTEEALDRISDRHGFTEREREVALLTIRGRSAPYISEELCLSQATIRTYQRRIYQKMSIHGKQELIDSVEAERCAGEERA